MPELLLHSLAEFDPLITELLDLVEARSVVEIGGEGGLFTQQLVAWAEGVDGAVQCVDPLPSDELQALAQQEARLTLVKEPSPDALGTLAPADAFVIDGDHNYHTVSAELRALLPLLRRPERPGLIVLHDVAWPNARRDSYYAPDRLPTEAVHENSDQLGAVPGRSALGATGFAPAGEWSYALHEGGQRNGVLTAVEDALSDDGDLELHVVPAVFGLGVVFASESPWAEAARAAIRPYQLPLIRRLEENRVELFIRLLEVQAAFESRARVHQLHIDRLEWKLQQAEAALSTE
jgi:Methyltransferase domain